MRVKAVIAYDGSVYLGFQKQTYTPQTVQHNIEKALFSLGIKSGIVGSGRTDARVHASGQVIHFDLPPFWRDLAKLRLNLNRKLCSIYVKHICEVKEDFHARFSAKKRIYRYVFKSSQVSVFEEKYLSFYENFEVKKLEEALACFVGKHDFDFFRKTGTQTHTSIREVYQASYVCRKNYHFVYFTANGFLRSQIRMMVAISMEYAQGKIELKQIKEQVACCQKHSTQLAPPQGLYLAKILYGDRG